MDPAPAPQPPRPGKARDRGTATAPLIPSRPLADRDQAWGGWRHGPVDPQAATEALPEHEARRRSHALRQRPRARPSQRLARPSQRLRESGERDRPNWPVLAVIALLLALLVAGLLVATLARGAPT